ncbi:hypothetical protein SDC9_118773 [bioreactor metagenome]|uniref:Uncharacterized protein n=1 Tax=bioreactor metagenome TaxID=1076179 RepID=A0A645C2D6_9ZZZZ
MNQPRYLRTALRLDGQHIAPVADGDDRFLQIFLRGLALEHAVELFAHALANDFDLPANTVEFRRGVIRNFILAQDAARDFFLYRAVRGQPVCKVAKKTVLVSVLQDFFCFPRGAHRLRNREQFPRAQEERSVHPPN